MAAESANWADGHDCKMPWGSDNAVAMAAHFRDPGTQNKFGIHCVRIAQDLPTSLSM